MYSIPNTATDLKMASAQKLSSLLEHIMGYFRKELSNDQRKELTDIIGDFDTDSSLILYQSI